MGGICILIGGSSYSVNYYILYCEPNRQLIYGIISLISCLSVFIALLFDKFHQLEFTFIKGLMFGLLGLSNGFIIAQSFLDSYRYSDNQNYIPLGMI